MCVHFCVCVCVCVYVCAELLKGTMCEARGLSEAAEQRDRNLVTLLSIPWDWGVAGTFRRKANSITESQFTMDQTMVLLWCCRRQNPVHLFLLSNCHSSFCKAIIRTISERVKYCERLICLCIKDLTKRLFELLWCHYIGWIMYLSIISLHNYVSFFWKLVILLCPTLSPTWLCLQTFLCVCVCVCVCVFALLIYSLWVAVLIYICVL